MHLFSVFVHRVYVLVQDKQVFVAQLRGRPTATTDDGFRATVRSHVGLVPPLHPILLTLFSTRNLLVNLLRARAFKTAQLVGECLTMDVAK